jgi:sigma-B regulation protein RsbQ
MPTRDAILSRNHVTIHDAPDNATTIVFAHGFGTDQTAWNRQIEPLRGQYRCIAFDQVGAGKSDLDAFSRVRYSTLYGYAQDLIEICDALDLREVRMVAHSVSGMVSMLASVLRPDLFSSLMVVGASPRYINDPDTGYIGGFEKPDVEGLFEAMSANYHAWAGGFAPLMMGNPDRPDLAHYFCETLLSIRPDVAQAVLKTIILSDHRAELPRVTVPVWISYAREDMAVPEPVSAFLELHLPKARRAILPATGHLPHISFPESVNAAIRQWLDIAQWN